MDAESCNQPVESVWGWVTAFGYGALGGQSSSWLQEMEGVSTTASYLVADLVAVGSSLWAPFILL